MIVYFVENYDKIKCLVMQPNKSGNKKTVIGKKNTVLEVNGLIDEMTISLSLNYNENIN